MSEIFGVSCRFESVCRCRLQGWRGNGCKYRPGVPRKLKGVEASHVVIDEAQFISQEAKDAVAEIIEKQMGQDPNAQKEVM